MILRATITVDIPAEDFIAAGEGQKRLEALHLAIRAEYPRTAMEIRSVRQTARSRSTVETKGAEDDA